MSETSKADSPADRELTRILRALGELPGPPVAGLADCREVHGADPAAQLLAAIWLVELRRRLGSTMVCAFATTDEVTSVGLPGEPGRPLLPWDTARAEAVAAQVGSLLLLVDSPPGELATRIGSDLSSAGCQVRLLGDESARAEPLALCSRLFEVSDLEARAVWMRSLGVLPEDRFLLMLPRKPYPDEIEDAIHQTARRSGLVVADVDGADEPIDLLAATTAAELVVTASPGLLAMALALGTPALGVDSTRGGGWAAFTPLETSLVACSPTEVSSLAAAVLGRGTNDELVRRLVRDGDLLFDDLAANRLSVPRVGVAAAERVAGLLEQVATLEAVNAGLRERLASERAAMAARIRSLRRQTGDSTPVRSAPDVAILRRAVEAEEEADELREEIARIYATRSMRLLAPLRGAYGRLRRQLR